MSKGRVAAVAGGLSMGSAWMFTSLCFSTDPNDAGPLQSIIGADVIIFAIYARFVHGEHINWKQCATALLLLLSIVCIAFGKDEGQTAGTQVGTEVSMWDRLKAILWSVCAMLSFFACNLACHVTASHDVDAISGAGLRGLGTCLIGILFLLYSYFEGSLSSTLLPLNVGSLTLWMLPLFIDILTLVGVWAVTRAFCNPNSSIIAMILSFVSVVVLILNAIHRLQLPSSLSLLGMALSLLAVVGFTLFRTTAKDGAQSSKNEVGDENAV